MKNDCEDCSIGRACKRHRSIQRISTHLWGAWYCIVQYKIGGKIIDLVAKDTTREIAEARA